MKIKSKNELIVKSFVQLVSSATTFSKRYKKVCRLLDFKPELTEEQWLYVWRGMYYSVWYTEMGKGCEILIKRIGTQDDLTMLLTGFKALTNDWFGIDAFRVDKYMFLVRIMSNTCLQLQTMALISSTSNPKTNELSMNSSKTIESNDKQLNESEEKDGKEVEEDIQTSDENQKNKKSSKQEKNKLTKNVKRKANPIKEIVIPIEMKANIIDKILTTIKASIGLTLHTSDIFIDELVKVFDEFKPKLKAEQKLDLYFDILLPFVKLMAISEDYRVLSSIKENIFDRFKNEVLVRESVHMRKEVLNKFIEAMLTIGGVEAIGRKNRDSIYNIIGIFKTKCNQLNATNDKKGLKRRKIIVGKGRHKKVKYELTSSSPFVTSIVPIAVV